VGEYRSDQTRQFPGEGRDLDATWGGGGEKETDNPGGGGTLLQKVQPKHMLAVNGFSRRSSSLGPRFNRVGGKNFFGLKNRARGGGAWLSGRLLGGTDDARGASSENKELGGSGRRAMNAMKKNRTRLVLEELAGFCLEKKKTRSLPKQETFPFSVTIASNGTRRLRASENPEKRVWFPEKKTE